MGRRNPAQSLSDREALSEVTADEKPIPVASMTKPLIKQSRFDKTMALKIPKVRAPRGK